MPQTCSICTHPKRDKIEACLTANTESLRDIAGQFDVSKSALERHRAHIPAHLAQAKEAREAAAADDLLARVKALEAEALGILEESKAVGDPPTALKAIAQARACLELLAKLTGELAAQPTVNVILSTEWLEVRTVLLLALERHPEARRDVLEALEQVNA